MMDADVALGLLDGLERGLQWVRGKINATRAETAVATATPDHPLMRNFELRTAERREEFGSNAESGGGWLREINRQLLHRHADLFLPERCLTSMSGTIDGHHYMVQLSRLAARLDYSNMDGVGTRYGQTEEIFLGGLADEVAAEIRREDDREMEIAQQYGYRPTTRYHFIPVVATGGVSIDPSTFNPVVQFATMRARIRLGDG